MYRRPETEGGNVLLASQSQRSYSAGCICFPAARLFAAACITPKCCRRLAWIFSSAWPFLNRTRGGAAREPKTWRICGVSPRTCVPPPAAAAPFKFVPAPLATTSHSPEVQILVLGCSAGCRSLSETADLADQRDRLSVFAAADGRQRPGGRASASLASIFCQVHFLRQVLLPLATLGTRRRRDGWLRLINIAAALRSRWTAIARSTWGSDRLHAIVHAPRSGVARHALGLS